MNLEQALEKISTLEETLKIYTGYFLMLIFILLAIGIILFALMMIESRNKDKKLKSSDEYLKYIIDAQEKERNRLSRELHDTVAQNMRYVSLLAGRLQKSDLQQEILIKQAGCIYEIRSLCYNLAPPDIKNGNFITAVKDLISKFNSETNLEARLTVVDDQDTQTAVLNFSSSELAKQTNLYRIIQEALQNIEKHAEASEVTVLIRGNENSLKIIITDDGKGIARPLLERINSETVSQPLKNHYGIQNIKERVRLLGGKLKYTSDESCGTEIKIEIEL